MIEERLRVGKREVAQGAVRVRSYVVETPAEEQVQLRQESVRVERRPVDRPASELPADAFRERTIEVQAMGEEAVVGKEARVVEEVALHKDVGERTETVRDTTRRTEVKVDDDRANAPGHNQDRRARTPHRARAPHLRQQAALRTERRAAPPPPGSPSNAPASPTACAGSRLGMAHISTQRRDHCRSGPPQSHAALDRLWFRRATVTVGRRAHRGSCRGHGGRTRPRYRASEPEKAAGPLHQQTRVRAWKSSETHGLDGSRIRACSAARGRYTDDTARPGGLHGVVLRSPHAAARIVSVDVAPALAVPGVVAAYTARELAADGIGAMPCPVELPNRDGSPQQNPLHPVLADGMVRHVGDPVAFVVARTPQAAADGAEAIGVEYEVADPVIDLLEAMEDGQKRVWSDAPHNLCFDWEIGDRARCDALFAGAAHVIRRRIVNNRVVVASMEPRAAAAEYDAGAERWTLTTNTQGVWLVRDLLAGSVFNVDPARIRVVTEDVGGGFGMKAFLYAEHALTCYAARKLGQPVKWTSGRSEAFLSDTQGRDNITFGELALDANGRFLALRSRNVANMGAYLSTYGPYIPTLAGSKVLPSVYRFETVYLNVLGVFTNTVPVDAYRGAGRPESNYLVERLVDAAARDLGIDPVELRRRNMVSAAEMPYRTPVGETYDSGEFARVMDAALARIDRHRLRRAPRRGGAAQPLSRPRFCLLPRSDHGRAGGTGGDPLCPGRAMLTCTWARNPPDRATRPPISRSCRSGSTFRPTASGSGRATAT